MAVGSWEEFRARARPLLAARVPPAEIAWTEAGGGQPLLTGVTTVAPAEGGPAPRVPAAFVRLAEVAARHADPERWALFYRIAFRITAGEKDLVRDEADDDVRRLRLMVKAIEKEEHAMHAFVRFHEVQTPEGARFVAWYRPAHDVLDRVAPFFAERMGGVRWSVLTPEKSVHSDGETLTFGPGLPREAAPAADEVEGLFLTYYGAIFNPARLNLPTFAGHVPRRRWETLPETRALPLLARHAGARVAAMVDEIASAAPFVPAGAPLSGLADAARRCAGCPLYAPATQTVFGEGPEGARLMLVGEQPGDEEDRRGRPFVGPAGAVLDRALAAAGIDRAGVYVTNAVKHFKFVQREGGKRRIHQKPSGRESQACRPWLMAEIERVGPTVLVALGGTAAQSLYGPAVRPVRDRGRPLGSPLAPSCFVTYHPSAVLRAGDPAAAAGIEAALRADLLLAARTLEEHREPSG